MTAAEILRSAEPPPDDGLIEKAIADLDMRIWEWADALKNAHSQLRGAFAGRPASEPIISPVASPIAAPVAAPTPGQRPSASLYEIAPSIPNLSAAAAAAHITSPPPMPAEWTAPPAAAGVTDWAAAAAATQGQDPKWSTPGGHGASSGGNAAAWAEPGASSSQGVQAADSQADGQNAVMAWPTAPAGGWPDSSGTSSPSSGAQAWPTWTPTEAASSASSSQSKKGAAAAPTRPGKPAKAAPRPAVEGPSPEERAQKAAAEEALLSQLEDSIARRVRLLRRLDPDTPIEKLIDKAKQGQAETSSAASAKDDKSSWWRRK